MDPTTIAQAIPLIGKLFGASGGSRSSSSATATNTVSVNPIVIASTGGSLGGVDSSNPTTSTPSSSANSSGSESQGGSWLDNLLGATPNVPGRYSAYQLPTSPVPAAQPAQDDTWLWLAGLAVAGVAAFAVGD